VEWKVFLIYEQCSKAVQGITTEKLTDDTREAQRAKNNKNLDESE
jgi:hypothetical protein